MRFASLHRGYCLATMLGVAVSGGCSSAGSKSSSGEQTLAVSLLQVESPTGFVVELTNSGQVPVAVCPCIGPPRRFIVFDLYYEDENRQVGYPEVLYSDGRVRRFYQCLKPGESLRVPVELRRWEPVWGRQRESYPPIDLLVGPGSYRVRALYTDSGRVSLRPCAGFLGRETSEWVAFELLDSSSSPDG